MDHGILGTFMRANNLGEPLWYRLSFPYILWPLKWVFMSCTIFMVVAISAERYRAICSPLTHRPKFWPYVIMVIISACKQISFPLFLKIPLLILFKVHSISQSFLSMNYQTWTEMESLIMFQQLSMRTKLTLFSAHGGMISLFLEFSHLFHWYFSIWRSILRWDLQIKWWDMLDANILVQIRRQNKVFFTNKKGKINHQQMLKWLN